MAFQPADNLKNRTFTGLIVAQFLAGFNDQAIHAAAMFYAIRQGILTESSAITFMPILFYAPWAIFCTLSGYFADRYSKTTALVTWKFSEVIIALFLLLGFYIGSVQHNPNGAWLVLSCVFLMGTHAAFFAPAKYGAMPEILQPHILSKGNGILESTTFLAAILGTVTGGTLIHLFQGQEYWIGIIILGLSIFGSVASLMIARLPPANPTRPFPKNLVKPLIDNLGLIFRSKPLALSGLGIAFFIFMVAYMRQVMYMHGETRVPHWSEEKTSLIVASVALGVALGSPLAGYLSGGKVELGMVPIGCFGMTAATLFAAFAIDYDWALVVGLLVIGFFSGFYMVPLYTLFQHRAPKTTKGDLVATSNFINVTGAIAASVLFKLLVSAGQMTGLTPVVAQEDNFRKGVLEKLEYNRETGRPEAIHLKLADGEIKTYKAGIFKDREREIDEPDFGFLETVGTGLEGKDVIISRYGLHGSRHLRIRLADQPLRPVYDNQYLPRYLFLGAALMTLCILVLLRSKLPDFFVRSIFWWKSVGKFRLKAVGMKHLPTAGPVILATNCNELQQGLQLVSATDRYTAFLLVEEHAPKVDGPLLKYFATGSLVRIPATNIESSVARAQDHALNALTSGNLLAVTVDNLSSGGKMESVVEHLRQTTRAPIVPVYCGPVPGHEEAGVRVIFGEAVADGASFEQLRQRIGGLAEWIRDHDHVAEEHH